jgi:protein O-GlcNAc transferase
MATIPETLAMAVQYHQAGQWQAAERLYRQILAVEPDHVDALGLLGVIAFQAGKHQDAVEYLGRAIALRGTEAALHFNLGCAHRAQGKLDEAIACYRRAVALKPDFAEAHNNLGLALKDQRKLDEAAASFRLAVALKPDLSAAYNNLGIALMDQGKLAEAVAAFRHVLGLRPDDAEAYGNLGATLKEQGKLDEAVTCIRQALALDPNFAEAHNNLGIALREQGRLDEAVASIRRALELNPDHAEAYCSLGDTLNEQGKLEEALACYYRALKLDPDLPEAHNSLGIALREQGKLDEAAACYRRAVALKPDFAEAHNNLGATLQVQGKLDEAVASCRRALELKPDFAGAHNNLGIAWKDQGKLDEAVACFRRALALNISFPEAYNNLGITFKDQERLDDAVASFRRAVELKPDYAEAHGNLGATLIEQGKVDEAVASSRRALELKPDYAAAHGNLGGAAIQQGKVDDAVASYRRAMELKRDFAAAHSNMLFALQYRDGATPSALAAAHQEYDHLHAEPLRAAWRPHENARDRAPSAGWSRPLRFGFVSPDFGRHPVGFFLIRALENLDRGQCQSVCYSTRFLHDDLTARFHAAAALWRDVVGLNNDQLVQRIREDRIDVLFDMAGHTAGNRLLAFARKPAPIQITWLGYEGTTGLAAMDYILADRYTIPPGSESAYRERVLRMPEGYACFDPPTNAPEPGPLPAIANGYVRFGSFNNLAKITPRVVEVWSKLLDRVPRSRLVLKYRGLGERSVRERYQGMFTTLGLDPARLDLEPPSCYAEYLAACGGVDVALDTFPFGGGVTTCNALWMGVPVVTCPGETFAGRHCLSHLASVGLTETIARDLDEYVEIAASLAGDLPRLSALRAGLRARMAASPLCDGKRFAANLMRVLRDAWREWCERVEVHDQGPGPTEDA